MNDLYQQLLNNCTQGSKNNERLAIYEVNQQIILSALARTDFFDFAAFYGGTCLRLFHKLPRFSEDMDFSLLTPSNTFHFEKYFAAILEEFLLYDRKVELHKKDKKGFSKIESAFLKDNTLVYDLAFTTTRAVKIKIEIDIAPPLAFDTEQCLQLLPYSFFARCYTLPSLYAGKMHALVFRNWKTRVKGRDWFDFEWYVRNRISLDFEHLQARIRAFNHKEMTQQDFIEQLRLRLTHTPIEQVKADVLPFIPSDTDLTIWSNNYFLQLIDKIVWK